MRPTDPRRKQPDPSWRRYGMRQLMAGILIAGGLVAGAACSDGIDRLTTPSPTRTSDVVAATAPDTGELILNNLDSPRGLTFGPEGALYVAEAGRGGPATDPTLCFLSFGAKVCYGPTGA